MAQVINTNIMSLNAQRNLNTSGSSLATSIQRLSSGLRINSAKDDAAGLAISERFSTQIRGMDQAARNANDGISMAQTAEGALTEIGNNLQRIRELAVQSRNATNSDSDREALNAEVQLLKAEIQRVAEQTNFNGTKLLDGSFQAQSFQIGADQGQTIDIAQIANANIKDLGNWNKVDTAATASAASALGQGGVAGSANYAPAVATTSGASGAFSTLTRTTADQTFTLTVAGSAVVTLATGAVGSQITAADIDTALASATMPTGVTRTGSAANGDLTFTKADGSAMTVAVAGTIPNASTAFANNATFTAPVTGTAQVGTAPVAGTFSAGNFTLSGTKGTATINFGAAGSSAQRATDLVKAINNQSYNTGVSASLDSDGKLQLASATGQFTIGGGTTLTEQTGLTATTTTNWAAGAAATGFADLDISTTNGADNALNAMDAALGTINSARADLGAVQNRFTSVVANLNTSSENMSAARSRISDTDYAKETAELTRTQILQQAGTAMLAQANQTSQNVLSLLR
ncbi:flagellin [Stenotrophomonas sp.]|uniref:flagellin N-terminal helical domain-containing protein n=1 Tax=Stenotrophomonas sp. TaxID=69392 RepID=UPI0028A7979A|nr:flagellin [Stenotrophomonas sp.]